ncbi:hypothetical protein LL253_02650 [Sphingobium soli]|uniref:Uncharacterized protein n=1 Tax=Sphingobium soli TaxID=1591116 RepID=A0ABS8H1G5_9SPHN|nr:hypothetical protein [Sphingobium soli]MCC4231587.1 hypothetical protein [Sphingobium soli]
MRRLVGIAATIADAFRPALGGSVGMLLAPVKGRRALRAAALSLDGSKVAGGVAAL